MIWILDAGHGGMIGGKYTTAPAKMFKHDSFTIFEGVINRAIVGHLVKLLKASDIEFHLVHDDVDDTPLAIRCLRANNFSKVNKNCVFLSVHSNAGGGRGFEVFTSKGQTKADDFAKHFCDSYQKHFTDFPFRKDVIDGDDDKEENFYVLRNTNCPALLVENLFFDEKSQAELLMSPQGQIRISMCLFDAIKKIENENN